MNQSKSIKHKEVWKANTAKAWLILCLLGATLPSHGNAEGSECGVGFCRKSGQVSGSIRKFRPVNWSLVGDPVGNHFKIVAGVSYCTGDPKPYIKKVRIRQGKLRIIVTAMAAFPSEKPSDEHGCLGIFRPLYKVVHLSTPSERLMIFDGSTDPPKQEWPYPPGRDQG